MEIIHKVHNQTPYPLHSLYMHIHFWPTAPPLPSMSKRIVFCKENMTDLLQMTVKQRTTNIVTK